MAPQKRDTRSMLAAAQGDVQIEQCLSISVAIGVSCVEHVLIASNLTQFVEVCVYNPDNRVEGKEGTNQFL